MRIGLHDSDRTDFPNLALMKLSFFHKKAHDDVEWFNPARAHIYDRIYSSKVFTWSKEPFQLPEGKTFKGGAGDNNMRRLSDYIEHLCPDYSLYGFPISMGFLTRGCIRECSWCIVPKKEGKIHEHADIEEFLRHDKAILLDNNVLAHEHGIRQIEKIVRLKIKVDFNQGLDARLIDRQTAKLLSKVKWLKPLRLACDSKGMIQHVQKAVEYLRWENTTPSRFFVYVLVDDVMDAVERVRFLKSMNLDPFAQPYRDPSGGESTQEQRDFARWCNHKAIFKTCSWEEYKGRKNNELSAQR